jgi:hypothetical protein
MALATALTTLLRSALSVAFLHSSECNFRIAIKGFDQVLGILTAKFDKMDDA